MFYTGHYTGVASSASGHCNNMVATYDLANNHLTVGQYIFLLLACCCVVVLNADLYKLCTCIFVICSSLHLLCVVSSVIPVL